MDQIIWNIVSVLVYECMSIETGLVGKFAVAFITGIEGIGVTLFGVLPQQLQGGEERIAVGARKGRSFARVSGFVQDVGVLAVEGQLTHVALQ